VAAVLAGSLGAIVFAERRHLRELTGRVLFTRWYTWLITAPIYAAAVLLSRWGALAFIAGLAFQAMREYATLAVLPRAYRVALIVAGLASLPVALLSTSAWHALPALYLLGGTLIPLLTQDTRDGVRNLAFTVLGFAYIPWLLAHFLIIRQLIDGGPGILLAVGVAVALSDVFAFAAGKFFGLHPLAPRVSPNKTLEGAAGNLAGAAIGVLLLWFALPDSLSTLARVLLPLAVAVGAVWGDLAESLIKRRFGVKDAGTWLPGFGGLLDQIDSFLFVLPLTYLVVRPWG
jgi:phosphatidate cytidylyltransferase